MKKDAHITSVNMFTKIVDKASFNLIVSVEKKGVLLKARERSKQK